MDWDSLEGGDAVDAIAGVIGDSTLAAAVARSIAVGLGAPWVVLAGGRSVGSIFRCALEAAVRDADRDTRADAFRRFVRNGPKHPDAPQEPRGDDCDGPGAEPYPAPPTQERGAAERGVAMGGAGPLSDAECDTVVEFIHSSAVNQFKGALAELLAISPVVDLVERFRAAGLVSPDARLYWGNTVQAPAHGGGSAAADPATRALRKGADGLVVEPAGADPGSRWEAVRVVAVVEVKSMPVRTTKLDEQLRRHRDRLIAGLTLAGRTCASVEPAPEVLTVTVEPSSWRLDRRWRSVATESGRRIEPLREHAPRRSDTPEQVGLGRWRITLAWSKEAIEDAAYEMTFWYWGWVGRAVYGGDDVPPEFGPMSPDEAGRNNVKGMLYALILRPITDRHRDFATKLYNIYSFSYPLAIDSKAMLWPEDFPHEEPAVGEGTPRRAPRLRRAPLPRAFEFDFRHDTRGWRAGFADYPVADEPEYHLEAGHRPLPPPLAGRWGGYYLAGTNRSDDLLMFLTLRATGLVPHTAYDVAFFVRFATNAPAGCAGVGGAPGESVFVKAGTSVEEPATRVVDGYARISVDLGSQGNGGRDGVVIGNVANSNRHCDAPRYEMKRLQSDPSAFSTTTGRTGAVWLIVAADSGYESTTALYFTQIRATFIPR